MLFMVPGEYDLDSSQTGETLHGLKFIDAYLFPGNVHFPLLRLLGKEPHKKWPITIAAHTAYIASGAIIFPIIISLHSLLL